MKNVRELNNEKLDQILIEKISGLSPEKRVYLLEWMKKEFPNPVDHQEQPGGER